MTIGLSSSASTPAAQADKPDLVREPNKWVQWCADQMRKDPKWWSKMVYVPYWGQTNLQHLARLVAASFELLGVQFAWKGDAYWSETSCLQCFRCPCYMPPMERPPAWDIGNRGGTRP